MTDRLIQCLVHFDKLDIVDESTSENGCREYIVVPATFSHQNLRNVARGVLRSLHGVPGVIEIYNVRIKRILGVSA